MSSRSETGGSRESTFGLRLDQLADLLAVAADDRWSAPAGGADKSADGQAEPPPEECLGCGTRKAECGANAVALRWADSSFRIPPCVLRPASDEQLLTAVKDRSKRLARTADSESQCATATTVYYAAIAACLVYHGRKVSRHSDAALVDAFARFCAMPQMPAELADLFERAVRVCRDRQEQT